MYFSMWRGWGKQRSRDFDRDSGDSNVTRSVTRSKNSHCALPPSTTAILSMQKEGNGASRGGEYIGFANPSFDGLRRTDRQTDKPA
jgi:hypothetical protein